MNKKILIVNEGSSDNIGDQLIQVCMGYAFEKYGAMTEFRDFSGNQTIGGKTKIQASKSKIFSLKNKIPTWIKLGVKKRIWSKNNAKEIESLLKKKKITDIVFGGGQMLQSNGVFLHYFKEWVSAIEKVNKEIKIHFVGVGLGPIKDEEKKQFGEIIRKAHNIIVRDSYSQKFIKDNYERGDVGLMPDVVHILPDIKKKGIRKNNMCLYGISSFDHLAKEREQIVKGDEFSMHYQRILEYEKEGYDIILFGTTKRDVETLHEFSFWLESKSFKQWKILPYLDIDSLIYAISSASIVCSPRMHALIIGKSYGVKIDAQPISTKISTYVDDVSSRFENLDDMQMKIYSAVSQILKNE